MSTHIPSYILLTDHCLWQEWGERSCPQKPGLWSVSLLFLNNHLPLHCTSSSYGSPRPLWPPSPDHRFSARVERVVWGCVLRILPCQLGCGLRGQGAGGRSLEGRVYGTSKPRVLGETGQGNNTRKDSQDPLQGENKWNVPWELRSPPAV